MNSKRLPTQQKQRFVSEVLWHFAGRNKSEEEGYSTVFSILENGLRVGTTNEEFKYVDPSVKLKTLLAYPVSCLADIPFKDLGLHADRYGRYAIGFHKESAINNNFNPVLYVNQFSSIFRRFMEVRDDVEKKLEKSNPELSGQFQELLLLLGSISKAGNIKENPVCNKIVDDFQLNNFYYEREWRSVYNWDFSAEDVAMVIVPDAMIKRFMKDRSDRKTLRIGEEIPIVPFSMIDRL